LLACALAAPAGATTDEPPLYDPPEPGSYELPVIDRVTEHWLLDSAGERAPLLGLAPGQVALVSFVYRACSDADGCPLAIAVMHGVDSALASLPDLAPRVRLVTASFDPDHDRPERMRELRESLQPGADWRFLTAADAGALAPVLADFNQDALRLRDPDGEPSARMRHVLKVFLVDHSGAVRNIYSTGLFDPQLVLNDVRTVIRETPTASR
jgi:cytochrome oxidase Cu insertion factor (SCO1/SenC/PrrC family)